MSDITRWEPMREMMTLREAMDRLFDDSYTHPFGLGPSGGVPVIDLYQTGDDVVVKASLPGLKADDVQISVTGDVLTLRGEFKQELEKQEATWHLREHRYGSFERSIQLPSEVQTDKAKADFENGILTITLPKSEMTKPKTITVKAK
jgi:HSP20 family protein